MFFAIFVSMRLLFLISILINFSVHSQTFKSDKLGLSTSVVLNFGTHVNSIGLSLKGYYSDYFYQINIGSTFCWNINSYGNRRNFWESRSHFGVVFLGGKKDRIIDFQLDGLNQQTSYRNGIAYNYIWYFDNAGTSQLSGAFALHINKISVCFENDLFAGQGKDRFRTGHLFFSYQYKTFKFGSGIYLWTGETTGVEWEGIAMKNTPYGFKRLTNLPYGKTSHGILYGTAVYDLGYGQYTHLEVGVDDEQIRHIIQNKLIHDLIFLPKSVQHNTPHYPRLNEKGFPVFNKLEKRKSKFYFQAGAN